MIKNPYEYRKGGKRGAGWHISKLTSQLEKVGATNILVSHGSAQVFFELGEKHFRGWQSSEAFIEKWPKTKDSQAIVCAWALLQDYMCACITRALINKHSDTEYWMFLTPFLLVDHKVTVEDLAIKKIHETDSSKLLSEDFGAASNENKK